ncbi:alpha/beta fold hydrolase [Pseudalkalibacillus decolorationis]|uniref:alpha/beta fold hydrolase n=1 Tax=Pseudalkalibacillus decolorationis TaxID=163879 RepID=UPI00214857B8|nr:alpha/beta hydrolase [Pseudalkalibacillus decolorationis]
MSKTTVSEAGHKVDIGSIKLYCELLGDKNDGPTFVFDSGYAWSLFNWNSIRDEVSEFARMFIYDRAGIGKSEKDQRYRHSKQSVENLHTLLQNANVKPPYVLVGHSFGGLNVRLFANTYPEEIAGVILLDSCHEDQNKVLPPLFSDKVRDDYFSGFAAEGSLSEFEESLEQVRRSGSLGHIPLIVVTGGNQPHHTDESMNAWMSFQKDLANLSTRSKHIIVENAGHAIHIDSPEAVINSIKEMLEMITK